MLKKLALHVLVVLIGAGMFAAVNGQVTTVGSISGTVRDSTGAAVPKAEVQIQDEQSGYARTVTSDDNGFYLAASVPVGRYTISTAPKGFKKSVAAAVELHVGENRTVNLDLQVGLVTETVTVTSDAAPVETRSGDVSSLIAEKQVAELPLNGRNYSQLALLVPGVSPATNGSFAAKGTGLDGGVDMSVNGNGTNQNLWTVDGVNNMDVGSNRTLLVFPSIDSIAEFRVQRNSFSAEYGQAQGAVINLVTKGGSNSFHGAGFEFLRSDALNANNFFLNKANQPKAYLKYNNFGGNFSGPIWKNKIFFFWSEEWRFEDRGTTVSGHVPTAAEKVGDYSGTLTNPRPRDPFLAGRCDAKGTVGGDFSACYPGDKIPTARLSPAGLALVKIFPDPNGGGNLWVSSPIQPVRTRQDSIRGDATLTSKMNLMVRFINEKWTHGQDTQQWGDVPFPTLADDWNQPSKSFSVKLTNTLSSTAVNDFQFSRAGNNILINPAAQSEALIADIAGKFPTVFPQSANVPSLMWNGGGYDNIWHEGPWQNHEDLWSWKDDFSKVVGSHDLKFGALYSHNIKNEQLGGGGGGNTPGFITGNGSKTGHAIADLLDRNLTLTNYQETDHTGVALGRWHDVEFYGNDTWKFRPTVTLTLGLRYSQFHTANTANNQISNLIPQFYDGVSYTSALITPETAGAKGLASSLTKPYNGGFQPRLGVAWDIFGNGKTALRMGFGRYLSRTNVIEDIVRMASNPPWTKIVDSGWSGASDTLAGCPTCRSMDAVGPNLKNQVQGVSNTSSFAAVDTDFRPPESYQWNLTVSRELMKNTVLEASYIGNHGLHIWRRNINWNDIPANQPCKGGAAVGCNPAIKNDARFQIATLASKGLDTGPMVAANRRIPTLSGITMAQSTGNSSYHGLQLWLNRRFSNRLAFQAAYTWAHAISDVPLQAFTNSTTDPFDYTLDKGDSDLDRRHTFVGNIVYALPLFKNWGPVASAVLGDWQLNGILSHYGSTPVDVLSGFNTYGTAGNVNPRPNLVLGVDPYLHTADKTQWLNPAAFSLPAVGQLGSLGKGSIRGKPVNNVDFSIAKNFKFKEKYGIQFRAEMFNVFNHANFGGYQNGLNFQGNTTLSNFGQPTNGSFGTLSTAQSSREMQFGFKFTF